MTIVINLTLCLVIVEIGPTMPAASALGQNGRCDHDSDEADSDWIKELIFGS